MEKKGNEKNGFFKKTWKKIVAVLAAMGITIGGVALLNSGNESAKASDTKKTEGQAEPGTDSMAVEQHKEEVNQLCEKLARLQGEDRLNLGRSFIEAICKTIYGIDVEGVHIQYYSDDRDQLVYNGCIMEDYARLSKNQLEKTLYEEGRECETIDANGKDTDKVYITADFVNGEKYGHMINGYAIVHKGDNERYYETANNPEKDIQLNGLAKIFSMTLYKDFFTNINEGELSPKTMNVVVEDLAKILSNADAGFLYSAAEEFVKTKVNENESNKDEFRDNLKVDNVDNNVSFIDIDEQDAMGSWIDKQDDGR